MAKRDKVALFLILDLLWQEERRRQEPELRLGWSAAWLAWAAAEPACLPSSAWPLYNPRFPVIALMKVHYCLPKFGRSNNSILKNNTIHQEGGRFPK